MKYDEWTTLRIMQEASRLFHRHEIWDGECPMNKEAEFNATMLDLHIKKKIKHSQSTEEHSGYVDRRPVDAKWR